MVDQNALAVSHGAYPHKLTKRYLRKPRMRRADSRLKHVIDLLIPKKARIIEMGASFGYLSEVLRQEGRKVLAVDGCPRIRRLTNRRVQFLDLVEDCSKYFGWADWGLCIEVGEHVPKHFEQKFITNVSELANKNLIVTWDYLADQHRRMAFGHVNPQPIDYVAEEFERRGWIYQQRETDLARSIYRRCWDRLLVLKR